MKNSISIVISTYNGVTKLFETLKGISQLNSDGIDFVELIIVDNASTDETVAFAQNTWKELGEPFALTAVKEVKPGKLYAQEAGFKIAKGAYIVICDDDNSLASNYLQIGVEYLTKHPEIGILGGRGIAVSSIEIPDWFEEFAYYFACAPQAPQTGNVMPTRNVVYGAGMWIRKSGYDQAKELGFQFILGSRTGKKLTTGGEDSELCWALKLLGFEIWYVDEMQFQHHIPKDRLTMEYRTKLLEGMSSNGPLSWVYLRIWKNDSTQRVTNYWIKELAYSLRDLLRSFLSKKDREYRKILVRNIKFYVKYRSEFDKKFNQVITYRNKCQGYLTNN